MKILVRGTNWVGDAVMTIPALRELRRIFPADKITLFTRSWARGIFQDVDFLDEVLTFDHSKSGFSNIYAQSKILKEGNFEMAVLFTNSFETALVTKLGKIPRRFGYNKEGRSFLLSDGFAIPDWKNKRHEVFYYLNLVAEIEQKLLNSKSDIPEPVSPHIQVSDERRRSARLFLEQNGIDLTKKTIALGVGSTNSDAKRWPFERFAGVNDLIQNELKANVILLGTKDELEVSNAVFEKSTIKPILLTGRTTLAEVVAVLSEIDLLVSNDMGLAHIAPAVGTATLVIFGPTNELTTQPLGSEIIRKKVECAPCMLRICPIDHRCMTQISVTDVFEKIKVMLQNKSDI